MAKKTVEELFQLILDRKTHPVRNSYTCSLFEKGEEEILKKVGEESVEVIIAAKGETRERLVEELADLLYHTLVLMAAKDITPDDIAAELERRFGTSGLKSKKG